MEQAENRDASRAPPFPGALPVACLGLDAVETGLLSVLRHLLTRQTAAAPEGWEHALRIAAELWGPSEGAAITLAAAALLRALRQTRPGPFRHADPLDLEARRHVSPEEAHLMRMLGAMRRGVTPEARVQMAKLTGGRIDPTLVRAGLVLARALPGPQSRGVLSRPGPALRLVH